MEIALRLKDAGMLHPRADQDKRYGYRRSSGAPVSTRAVGNSDYFWPRKIN
jgi:hypothetical protein